MHPSLTVRRRAGWVVGVGTLCAAVLAPAAVASSTTTYPSDTTEPDVVPALSGYDALWKPSGLDDLHGTVLDTKTLQRNDQLVSWINQHATIDQKFRSLQNSAYGTPEDAAYDQSMTIADGLGTRLGQFYVRGRLHGDLPLTSALINSESGSTGAYVDTGDAKARFSHPRPYLQNDPSAAPVPGDDAACDPQETNSSSLTPNRVGMPWASPTGRLTITRVPTAVDTTHRFSDDDVTLDVGYGDEGLCTGGSYPSGHTTTAYEAGLTLATLLPELAPEILTRASEAGNNRLVLGVHYPLDIVGGRIDGEIALAARWSDARFRTGALAPARTELVSYLTAQCRAVLQVQTLAKCIAADTAYSNNPYGRKAIPGGTAQVVTNRASAMKVYRERMSYGFAPTGSTRLSPSVPSGAENLLLTTYPTLTAAQRRQVLAQTEIASGHPLDTTAAHRTYPLVPGSWQRLDLAAAMSAKVAVRRDGDVVVVSTGGKPTVVR